MNTAEWSMGSGPLDGDDVGEAPDLYQMQVKTDIAPIHNQWDDYEVAGSYSWLDIPSSERVIAAPAGPPQWSPQELPYNVPLDHGKYYADENAARSPEFPMEPALCATMVANPSFSVSGIDILTDRRPLSTLLSFVDWKSRPKSWHRRDWPDHNISVEDEENGKIGYEFERHFTTQAGQLEDASNHYRIITYPIGSMKIMMRTQIDACLVSPFAEQAKFASPANIPILDDGPSPYTPIIVEHCGTDSAYEAMELKTLLATTKPAKVEKFMEQSAFGRTCRLVIGRHARGAVTDMEQHDMNHYFPQWQSDNEASLQALVWVLKTITQVKDRYTGSCSIFCSEHNHTRGRLVFERMLGPVLPLPVDVLQRYWPDEVGIREMAFVKANMVGQRIPLGWVADEGSDSDIDSSDPDSSDRHSRPTSVHPTHVHVPNHLRTFPSAPSSYRRTHIHAQTAQTAPSATTSDHHATTTRPNVEYAAQGSQSLRAWSDETAQPK
ncbi:hypothetical protein BDV97DRAFT_392632 [Delphinella strobiligena]|nr:hypothetical protein BDV97DRAFT_392632 [Delphinella strobiligena]